MHISYDWVSNIHWRSKHVKYYRYLTYLTLPPATNFYVFGKRTRVIRPVTIFARSFLPSLYADDVKMPNFTFY